MKNLPFRLTPHAIQSTGEDFEKQWANPTPTTPTEELSQELKAAWQRGAKDIAQECYLQCLAIECGEGECSQAIASKFPELVTRLDEESRLDLNQLTNQLEGGQR